MQTDAELVEGALGGDPRCFEQIMRTHNERLFRTARSILGDDAEAEDTLQQAYLSAYRALPSFRGDAKLSTWLTRITIHAALRRVERRGRGVEIDDSIRSATPTPEERAMQADLRRTLEDAIDELDRPYRLVFVMRDVQGLSTREVSESLAVTEETVRVRLHRARRSLRAVLSGLDVTPSDAFAFAGARCNRIVASVLTTLAASSEPEADRQLVRAVASGDRSALGELYDRHAQALYAIAMERVQVRRRAEDVVHDTFLELWRGAHRLPSRTSVRAWLADRARARC